MYICIRKCIYIYVYIICIERCTYIYIYIERERERKTMSTTNPRSRDAAALLYCQRRSKIAPAWGTKSYRHEPNTRKQMVKPCQTMATFSEAFGPWKFAGSRNISKFKNAEPFARYMSLRNFLSWHSLAIPLGWLWVSTGNVRCVAWGHPIWNLEIQSHRSYWHVVYCAYPIKNI